MSSAEVVIVGSCMTDLVSYVPRLPKTGETIKGQSFSQGFGGKGANQCIMAARLGVGTAMIGKVGDDAFGHNTIKNFKDNNVNAEHVYISQLAPSGVAPIIVNDQGENAIVIISGANNLLSPEDVLGAKELIVNAKVVVCQLEIPSETTLQALRLAKQNGIITIFNAAPGQAGLEDEFYKNTDILCVNETEAELMSGKPVTDLVTGRTAVTILLNKGPKCVVLTMGGAGVLFTDMSGSDIHHIPAQNVNVIDTTGAGDAFVGALAYYLAKHKSLSFSEMIKRSSAIATHTVTIPGTQTSFIIDTLPQELFQS